jgi:hypothetical protein
MSNAILSPASASSASALVGLTLVAGLTFSSASSTSLVEANVDRTPIASAETNASGSTGDVVSFGAQTSQVGSATKPLISSWPDAASRLTSQLVDELKTLSGSNRENAARITAALSFLAEVSPAITDMIAEVACSRCDDGSVVLELMLAERRIGFSFEPDESASSWFIASIPPSTHDGRGYLRETNPIDVLVLGLS